MINKNFFLGLFVGIGLLAVFAFKDSGKQDLTGMQKWEYNHVTTASGFPFTKVEQKLNELGSVGWELVAITANSITLKRPLE